VAGDGVGPRGRERDGEGRRASQEGPAAIAMAPARFLGLRPHRSLFGPRPTVIARFRSSSSLSQVHRGQRLGPRASVPLESEGQRSRLRVPGFAATKITEN
jgi:hypothetical protein